MRSINGSCLEGLAEHRIKAPGRSDTTVDCDNRTKPVSPLAEASICREGEGSTILVVSFGASLHSSGSSESFYSFLLNVICALVAV